MGVVRIVVGCLALSAPAMAQSMPYEQELDVVMEHLRQSCITAHKPDNPRKGAAVPFFCGCVADGIKMMMTPEIFYGLPAEPPEFAAAQSAVKNSCAQKALLVK